MKQFFLYFLIDGIPFGDPLSGKPIGPIFQEELDCISSMAGNHEWDSPLPPNRTATY